MKVVVLAVLVAIAAAYPKDHHMGHEQHQGDGAAAAHTKEAHGGDNKGLEYFKSSDLSEDFQHFRIPESAGCSDEAKSCVQHIHGLAHKCVVLWKTALGAQIQECETGNDEVKDADKAWQEASFKYHEALQHCIAGQDPPAPNTDGGAEAAGSEAKAETETGDDDDANPDEQSRRKKRSATEPENENENENENDGTDDATADETAHEETEARRLRRKKKNSNTDTESEESETKAEAETETGNDDEEEEKQELHRKKKHVKVSFHVAGSSKKLHRKKKNTENHVHSEGEEGHSDSHAGHHDAAHGNHGQEFATYQECWAAVRTQRQECKTKLAECATFVRCNGDGAVPEDEKHARWYNIVKQLREDKAAKVRDHKVKLHRCLNLEMESHWDN